jgi:hypothetical protein
VTIVFRDRYIKKLGTSKPSNAIHPIELKFSEFDSSQDNACDHSPLHPNDGLRFSVCLIGYRVRCYLQVLSCTSLIHIST